MYFTVNYCDEGWGGGMEDDFLSYFVGFALFHRGVIKFMYVKTCCESENGKKWKSFACFIYWRSSAPPIPRVLRITVPKKSASRNLWQITMLIMLIKNSKLKT